MFRLSRGSVFTLLLAVNAGNAPLYGQDVAPQNSAQKQAEPSPPVKSNYVFAERDWNVLISQLHSETPPSDAKIQAFVLAAVGAEPQVVASGVAVCSAGFFQIAESADESLVASLDVNGRHFCNEIEVIHGGSNGVMVQEIDAWEVDDVQEIVRGLGNNGKNVLVIPTEYSDYDGAECLATWDQVYVLQSGALVDRSAAFTDFYKERLEGLNAKLRQAGDVDTTCTQMEADKILRFLGISPLAGEDNAKEWINSSDRSLRLKGIAVLADIGDKQSISALQRFTEDPETDIADAAKRALGTLIKK